MTKRALELLAVFDDDLRVGEFGIATRTMGACELVTYDIDVPGIGANCGLPSNFAVNFGPFFSGTLTVCAIEFSLSACFACGVPATVCNTAPASDVGGMFAKSGGSALLATNDHWPFSADARNQRPDSSRK